jgi:hypothetical protein
MSDLQRIARQVLMERREAQRLSAIQRRRQKDDLERYEAELNLIIDDLCADGFERGSPAMWEAALRTLTARHLTRGGDELEARMRDTGF